MAVLGLSLALTSPALASSDGPYQLQGTQSGRCIDDPNGSTANNVTMIIYTCDKTRPIQANQQWYYVYTNDRNTVFQVRNVQSGKCLTVRNASPDDNAAVIQYDCNQGANELWSVGCLSYTPGSGVPADPCPLLINLNSGRCLTVKNNGTANNSTLLQFHCNNGANQDWYARSAG